MLDNLFTLVMLILLQAVLGFDNLLYISIESKRAPIEKQPMVRMWGIGIAIVLRLGLLFLLVNLLPYFQNSILPIHVGFIDAEFTIHSLIVLGGGVFIMYTAVKEIWHMVYLEESEETEGKSKSSIGNVILWIVIMNIIFSFDSILSAMALSDVFWVMATAIVISGVMMIWLSGTVSTFLHKNRLYEVLGLFILLLVGVMLISEGGHLAELVLFGGHVTPLSKTTFYFVIFFLVVTDIVQGRYQRKLLKKRESKQNA
ncbi:MAG: tellurium resistance protein TerC [bacterium]|nr:tellurium resistance protein TerC [bacterium]